MTSSSVEFAVDPMLEKSGISRQLSSGEAFVGRPGDQGRLIEGARVMLAIMAAVLIVDVEQGHQVSLAWAVILYGIYAVWGVLKRNGEFEARMRRFLHWGDALWFLAFMFLADDPARYFLFLFFPVFFAAREVSENESVAVAAFGAFASILVLLIKNPGISWLHLLTFPAALFVVGSLFAALARVETATNRGHELVEDLLQKIDTRRGLENVVASLLEELGRGLSASATIFVVGSKETKPRAILWETEGGASELAETAVPAVVEAVMPPGPLVAWNWVRQHGWRKTVRLQGLGEDGRPIAPATEEYDRFQVMGALFETGSIISLPLSVVGAGPIRIVIVGENFGGDTSLLGILQHIVNQLVPVIENAILKERLAAEAAETERARIGRDLHDSALQPYIGLKFALEALRRQADGDNPLAPALASLVDMVSSELKSMREVISGLRGVKGQGDALLLGAVRRQAERFGQLFGIQVDIEVEGDMPVSRRLAGELFHIVAEGLSNVRRHSSARKAVIRLASEEQWLTLSIRNESGGKSPPPDFVPRSLAQRTEALGGILEIEANSSETAVNVKIPLVGTPTHGSPPNASVDIY